MYFPHFTVQLSRGEEGSIYRMRYAIRTFGDAMHTWVLQVLCEALVQIDEQYLRANSAIPLLADSGVTYESENDSAPDDDWRDIPTVLAIGAGDCDDLACWRCAELRVRYGLHATPYVSFERFPDGTKVYHIRVRLPDGSLEDPSAQLGMGA